MHSFINICIYIYLYKYQYIYIYRLLISTYFLMILLENHRIFGTALHVILPRKTPQVSTLWIDSPRSRDPCGGGVSVGLRRKNAAFFCFKKGEESLKHPETYSKFGPLKKNGLFLEFLRSEIPGLM